jgi:hypothetical protein
MKSKRSAKPSQPSRDSRENKRKSSLTGQSLATQARAEEREEWERQCSPVLIEDLKEVQKILRKPFAWLYAEPEEARKIAYRATFPRSIAGDRQDDPLLRVLAWKRSAPLSQCALLEITKVAGDVLIPENVLSEASLEGKPEPFGLIAELHKQLGVFSKTDHPKTPSEFFQAIAEGLRYLESFQPTITDFIVEELQNAFVGLMQGAHNWGKTGIPTKGKVIEMAKVFLEKKDRKASRSAWSKALKTAELAWLPKGAAGRPSEADVDEVLRAKKLVQAGITRLVNEQYRGDWATFYRKVHPAFGGKATYQEEVEREEEDRRRNSGQSLL